MQVMVKYRLIYHNEIFADMLTVLKKQVDIFTCYEIWNQVEILPEIRIVSAVIYLAGWAWIRIVSTVIYLAGWDWIRIVSTVFFLFSWMSHYMKICLIQLDQFKHQIEVLVYHQISRKMRIGFCLLENLLLISINGTETDL